MHLRLLLLLIIALILVGCPSEGYEIVRGAVESGAPEEMVLEETTERVYNCGSGGDIVKVKPRQSRTLSQAVYWELGAEIEAEAEAPIRLVQLGGELQAKYGEGYEKSAETSVELELPAKPGEWIEYTIRWSEIWHKGDVIQKVGNRQETVKYRYRKSIKTEITGKKMLDCGPGVTVDAPAEEVATEIPTPSAEATPIPSPVAPQPTSITDEYQVIVHGFGIASADMTNSGQRRRAAILAAEMDAKRKLAEWLAGADIASITVTEQSQLTIDTIRQEIRTHLLGVQIVEQTYDEESGEAEVTLGVLWDDAN